MRDRMEPAAGNETSAEAAGTNEAAAGVPDCSCAEARAHLEAFLDRECTADLTERLAQHVATCPYCSRIADAETHLREILRSRCAEQAPPELRARVLGRLSTLRATAVSVTTTSTTTQTRTTASGRVVRIVESRVESSRTVHVEGD
ncbi:mycothiol system anti-sigma-R factor [Actinomyces viscosus]|uniref:mycothiol system anti-sigma-R factor n=1 Tax=Actinomyces viscosus TaxID=1656 RepID=UPI0028E82E8B|nr:mycothiol system anti-sigma-R factor [Actinomyces viscosus]